VTKYKVEGALVLGGIIILEALFFLQSSTLSANGTSGLVKTIGVPLDDVYIHCRYAQNILAGNGYCFNPGKMVTADTSPLWVLLIAIGGLLTKHLEVVAVILSSLFYLALAPLGYRIAKNVFGMRNDWSIFSAVMILILPRIVWSAPSGMEITLACLLTLLAISDHARQRRMFGNIRLREGIYLALGIAVRPELMYLALVLFADWSIYYYQEKTGYSPLLKSIAVFLIFVAPVFLLPLVERGSLVYHSSEVQGAHIYFIPNWYYFWFVARTFLANYSIPILASTISVYYLRKESGWIPVLLFGLGLPIILAFVAPQFRHHGRYFFPILPLLTLAGTQTISSFIANRRMERFSRLFQIVVILVCTVGMVCAMEMYSASVSNIVDQHLAALDWIEKNCSKQDIIAAHDVGAIGYFTERKIIDLVGLVSPEMYPLQNDQAEVWRTARREGANVFIIYNRLNPGFYKYAKDSLEFQQELRVRSPLTASADTVMSIYRLKGEVNAAR
jgi:hypothetical protein